MVSDRSNGSNRREGIAPKLGFGFAVVLATAAIGWGWNYGLVQEIAYEQEAREAHADQSKNGCYQIAEAQPQTIPVKQADGKPCTPSEEAQKENDNRRDYADLVAQRSSALWAKIMGVAALIGMGLSLVGAVLVWITFREARKANDIATENTKLELRPYLYIDSIDNIIEWTISTGRFTFETKARVANLTLKNFGQSPAKKIHIKANASIGEGPHSRIIPDLDSTDFKLIGDIPPNGVLYYEACKIPEIDKPTTERIQRAGESIFLEGQICYEDGFGTPYHTNFQFAYTGEKYWGKPPMITPNWNDAT